MKKRNASTGLRVGVAVALWFCIPAFSQSTNSFFQFVGGQSHRQYTQVPHEVLAFYYGWYGLAGDRNPWGKADTNAQKTARTARYPVMGAYSSHDPDVVDWQIDQARAHGVTGFVVSWWGTAEWEAWHNRSLALLLERAERKNFKISIYWEQTPGEGSGQIERAVNELSSVLTQHGRSAAFLKVDGKPVVFIYSRVVSFQMPLSSWPATIEGVRARAGDFVLIADGHQGSWAYLFHGIHSYDLSGLPGELQRNLTVNRLGDLRAWAARYYEQGVTLARRRGRISCLLVTPGIDCRKAYGFDWQTDRLKGQTYRTLWEEAIRAGPDWVIITSWNEWPEGTEIEPSVELGDQYLQLTAEYASRFLKSAPVAAPSPAAPIRTAPGTTQDLGRVLSGRRIGVLAQQPVYDTEFWAAYCGARLQRLNWSDLIDPVAFNASNFPVLLHIASEHYTSSVKVTDDVTRSLMRYLREGGFLVSLPSAAPWPFYYDDSRKAVPHAITDLLALGVDNGFESPQGGAELIFCAKTNVLFGLPATAPFPGSGDLRWRPASRTRVPEADIYVPLVQLRDQNGNPQGDAVAYIEHRTVPLAPGKTIYVWMRTAEAFGPDVFLPSLYQFISTRLKPVRAGE